MSEKIVFPDKWSESLYASAMLGENTRSFLATDIGQFVEGCAKQDIDACAHELLTVPTWNKRKIKRLQMKAAAAKNFIGWLDEAMAMGEQSHQQLIAKQEEER